MSALGKRVCVGAVAGAHGVRGAVKIKSFTGTPEDIARYGALEDESGERHFTLRLTGAGKGVLIGHLSGIADRNQAEAARGLRLYLQRAVLPPTEADEYYHADLIGLEAVLSDGTAVGRVRAVHDFGAGDTLEIARAEGPPLVVPLGWSRRVMATRPPKRVTAAPIRASSVATMTASTPRARQARS